MKRRNVAILLFNDVEVLDFAGPFEVFSVADELSSCTLFNVFIVAETNNAIIARNGLSVNPDYTILNCPKVDILIIPGGDGTRPILEKKNVLEWVQLISKDAELVLSICTGALVLAKAGILEGLQATTHHEAFDELSSLTTNTKIIRDERYVNNSPVITSAGVSAGIDMCLYVVDKLLGYEHALKVREYIEYDRT